MSRCAWAQKDILLQNYHDAEWGVPLHSDRKLFEFLVLDTFQAGLSWLTILRKRENFRQSFHGFNPATIATYDQQKVEEILSNTEIIRNRLKIDSTVINARKFLEVQREFGSFDSYIWRFTDGKTKTNAWKSIREVPPRSERSEAMSKDLKKKGFRFVGATICYAFMQAAGMVNDHTTDCFRYKQLRSA